MLGTSIVLLPVTHWYIRHVLRIRLAEHSSVLWRPAVAAIGMGLLVREFVVWTEHGLAASKPVVALASAIVLGVLAYVLFTGLLWALSGFPQSAEVRLVNALDNLLGALRRKASATRTKSGE
jgi:hypothetical protein